MPTKLLLADEVSDRPKLVQIEKKPVKQSAANKKLLERGCEFCPSNNKKGINKVFGKVKGKDLFIVGMAPGRDENEEQKEFVGKSGKFLWGELGRVGIKRKDCDVQNVVRCFPSDRVDGRLLMRDPSAAELHCCSKYTDRAVKKSEAKVYIVLGEKAHKQFLGKEYKKTRKIFWSEKLQAKVYCLYHPSYFVRGMYPQVHLDDFRKSLGAVVEDLKHKGSHSRTSYLEQQDYQAITTVADAHRVKKILFKAGIEKKVRIAVDTEEDMVDGKYVDLCIGFSYKPGQAFVFVTNHPRVRKIGKKWHPLRKKVIKKIKAIAADILREKRIKKVLQHGSHDAETAVAEFGTSIRGYDFDTEYAEFLVNPDRRQYGLAATAAARFPRFGEYKNIIYPDVLPKDVDLESLKISPTDYDKMHQLAKTVGLHMSQLPLRKLVLRNAADADITKRIELTTKKKVNLPLLRIYKDAAFVLAKMEPNGPAFDFAHCHKLRKLYPRRLELVQDKLKQIAGKRFEAKVQRKIRGSNLYETITKVFWDDASEKTEFNPGSPIQVKALFFLKLKLKAPPSAFKKATGFKKGVIPERKKSGRYFASDRNGVYREISPSTGKAVMEILLRKHEPAQLLTEYRRYDKIESTYLDSYESCAKQNGGLLRTRWNLTGTRTGRLSSGGNKEDAEGNTKVVNLQNIHGDPNMKNQVVADPDWRLLYDGIHKAVKRVAGTILLDAIAKAQGRLARIPQFHKKAKELRKVIDAELYGDKEKKTVGLIPKLLKKLDLSLRFKKLCRKLENKFQDLQVMLGFDQGQVEVRVMAQASGDKNLIRDCKSGDIHSKVGHKMTGWSIEDIKKDKKTRTLTKNIHFGILFGLGAAGLMAFIRAKDPDSTITEEEAQRLYDNYFKAYPGVAKFIEKMRKFVEENGYVENMFGFKRPLGNSGLDFETGGDEEFESDSGGVFWGNQAINTPIQGAAHIIMLMAMAIMKRQAKKYKDLLPTLEIHDYMGFKCKLKNIFSSFKLVKQLLTKEPLKLIKREYPEIKWKIPLEVEGVVGLRLGDSVEADGKSMSQLFAEMFVETFTKECRLDADLELLA